MMNKHAITIDDVILILKYPGGDEKTKRRAFDFLVKGVEKMIWGIIWKHAYWLPQANKEDLFARGMVELSRAIENFDPTKGVKFTTYLYKYVNGGIAEAVGKLAEIAKHETVSLEQEKGMGGEEELSLKDILPAPSEEKALTRRSEFETMLQELVTVGILTKQESDVVGRYFGFIPIVTRIDPTRRTKDITTTDVAKSLNLSQARISLILQSALEKLRNPEVSNKFKVYLREIKKPEELDLGEEKEAKLNFAAHINETEVDALLLAIASELERRLLQEQTVSLQ